MTKVLKWLRDTVGGFCAAFLVWLIVGSGLGHGLARPVFEAEAEGLRDCWPVSDAGIMVYCESRAAEAVWHWLVEVPSTLVRGLAGVTSQVYYCVHGEVCWLPAHLLGELTLVIVIGLMIFAGFRAWRTLSEPLAWALILALIAEIVLIAF